MAAAWTTERVERLNKLWQEGWSAACIASELGEGLTRHSVISKLHRTGAQQRAQTKAVTVKTRPRAYKTKQGVVRFKRPPVLLPVPTTPEPLVGVMAPISQRRRLVELNEFTCRWPHGDPLTDEFWFCGARSDLGLSYCSHHKAMSGGGFGRKYSKSAGAAHRPAL